MNIGKPYLLKNRKTLIFYLYKHYVMNEDSMKTKQVFLDNDDKVFAKIYINQYLKLFDHLDDLERTIQTYLSAEWTWERLNNLYKAALVVGCFEIMYLGIDKAIIIDQILNFIHIYDVEDNSNFVHSVLDHISYHKTKD